MRGMLLSRIMFNIGVVLLLLGMFTSVYAQAPQQTLVVDGTGAIAIENDAAGTSNTLGKVGRTGAKITEHFPVITPLVSFWDQTPWLDSRINFSPGQAPQFAGDLDGDGISDRFITANTADERSGDLSARVNKTIVYLGGEFLSTEPDAVVYDNLFPVGRLFGGEAVMVAYSATDGLRYFTFTDGLVLETSFVPAAVASLDLFNMLTANGSRQVLHSIDLDGDGFEDVVSLQGTEIRVVYGAATPEAVEPAMYDMMSYATELGLPMGNQVLLDAFEYAGSTYIIAGSRNQNVSESYAHVLRLDETGEMELVQALPVVANYFAAWGIVRAIFMDGPDGVPSLLYSSGTQNLSYVFPPSSTSDALFNTVAGPAGFPVVPAYDLYSNGFAAFYRDNSTSSIGIAIGDPTANVLSPVAGTEMALSSTSLFFDHNLINWNSYVFPDLDGDGFTDFMLPVSQPDFFGSRVYFGGINTDFETMELYFDRQDYAMVVRNDVFPLGDVTGNGLDDFGIAVFFNGLMSFEVYEGGNFFFPVAVINTPFVDINFAAAGYFTDVDRRDIAILGRYPGFNPAAPNPNILVTQVDFYMGGSAIGTTPYNTIMDTDVYPSFSWLNNVLGTMTNIGDVNNSGYDDLFLGAPTITNTDNGQPFASALYFGGPNMGGAPDQMISTFSPTSIDARQAGWFANSVHGLGDINGDGIDDFAVAATNERLDQARVSAGHQGAVHVFFGKDGNMGSVSFETSDLVLKTNLDDALNGVTQGFLGFGEIAVGDFNGDGYPDIAVPTFWHRLQADISVGFPGIHIYNGGPQMSGEPDHMVGLINEYMAINPVQSYYTAFMGPVKMSGLPDITGDGFDELLIVPGQGYHHAVLLEGGFNSLYEEPIAVFESPLYNQSMGSRGNFINRQFTLATGDFTGDGNIEFVVAQPFSAIYRDTPVFMFSTEELSSEPYSVIIDGNVEEFFISPGQTFTMDITIGTEEMPVFDLLGVGLQVQFDTEMIEFVDFSWGDFLFTGVTENDVLEFGGVDGESGVLALSLSRQGTVGGTDGFGLFASITFIAKAEAFGETLIDITEVMAINSFGDELPITTSSPFIMIFDGVFVWPGDTNNDGIVDISDVLPVGAWFGSTGPERPLFDLNWFPQVAYTWEIESLTYVDATGDGVINQNDILPIGLNFGLSTEDAFFFKENPNTDLAQYLVIPAGYPVGPIQTTIRSTALTASDGFIGVAADFSFDAEFLSATSGQAGSLLASNQLLRFDHDYEDGDGLYSIAATRLGSAQAVSGEGEVLNVTFDLLKSPETDIMIRVDRFMVTHADRSVQTTGDFVFASPVMTSATVSDMLPTEFSLSANYPNPFNPTTTISYSIPELTEVRLDVFDVMGRRVATLVNTQQAPGAYTANFNAAGLASGVYVYRLQAGAFMQTRSMMLIK